MSCGLKTVSAVPLISSSGAEGRSSHPCSSNESLGALATQSSNVFRPKVEAKVSASSNGYVPYCAFSIHSSWNV